MRPRRLQLRAFGPFAGTVEIDFDALAVAGLFLIHGETGAGKSSLLDAMCFALYGTVPGARTVEDLRSHHARSGDTSVVFDFSVRGEDWRIARSPAQPRPKRRGTGFTTQKPKVSLSRRTADGWHPRAEGVEEVALLVHDLLGLTAAQFQQVVVLPQGEFQRVLRATPREREELLSSLFRTGRFSAYVAALAERARFLETEVERRRDELATVRRLALARWSQACDAGAATAGEHAETVDGDADLRAVAKWVEAARAGADALRQAACDEAGAAREEHRRCSVLQERLERRGRAQTELRRCEAEADGVEAARRRLAAAERAEPGRGAIEAEQQAATALGREAHGRQVLAAELDALLDSLPPALADPDLSQLMACAAGSDPAATSALLAPLYERLQERRPVLAGLVLRLEEADALAAEATRERSAAKAAAAAAQRHDAERVRLAGERAAVAADLERARLAHAGVAAAEADASRLRGQAGAAQLLVEAEGQVLELSRRALQAHDQTRLSATEHLVLLEKRIADMAGELALALAPGAPCAVCGSRDHPRPAPPPDEPVTQAKLDRVADEAAFAREVAAELDRDLQAARARCDELRSRAGDAAQDPAGAEARAACARRRLADLQVEASRVDDLAAALDRIGRTIEECSRAATEAHGRREACAARAERVAEAAQRERAAVEASAGGTDVVAVLAAADALLAALTELRGALNIERDAHLRLVTARDALRALSSQQGFASTADLAAALLPAREQQRLRAGVSAHDAALRAAQDVLADPELADLPPPGELVVAAARAEAAGHAAERAIARHAALAAAATELSALADEAERLERELHPLSQDAARVRRLAGVCNGTGNDRRMSLERYVLAARMEEITAVASARFSAMSDGRYTLRHSDQRVRGGGASGLSILVGDAWTGVERDVGTLSGGETFQASLAFALAVVDVVQHAAGGVQLDTLFVDEGFGSLDADALDGAMAEIDRLREGGRVVGIISHVPVLCEQIGAGIEVRKATTGSTVEVRAGRAA